MRNNIYRVDGLLRHEGTERITSELRIHLMDVEMLEDRLSASDQSFNAPMGENGEAECQNFIVDARPLPEQTVFEHIEDMSRFAWLREVLDSLSKRERIIIRTRRLRDETVTPAELGRDLGISKERVHQIKHKELEKLRVLMACGIDRPDDLILE